MFVLILASPILTGQIYPLPPNKVMMERMYWDEARKQGGHEAVFF